MGQTWTTGCMFDTPALVSVQRNILSSSAKRWSEVIEPHCTMKLKFHYDCRVCGCRRTSCGLLLWTICFKTRLVVSSHILCCSLSCEEGSLQGLLSSHQLQPVCLFSSDLWHGQGVAAQQLLSGCFSLPRFTLKIARSAVWKELSPAVDWQQ